MKAARLNEVGVPLQIEEIPVPSARVGGVVVKVLASQLMSYTDQVIAGKTGMRPPVPYTPGLCAVGVVESIGEGVVGLAVGESVLCTPYYVAGAKEETPESILIGWFGMTPGADPLLALWKNGAFAEYAQYPVECVTPLGDVSLDEPARLSVLNWLTIAYGALIRGGLQPGQRVVVSGATGNVGSCVVLLALAMGASRVVATGRSKDVLETLAQLDPSRMTTVVLEGEAKDYAPKIKEAAGGADLVIDALGMAQTPDPTVACLGALRPGGTAVFVGGVRTEIPISYSTLVIQELTVRGSFMYPPSAPAELLRMIAAKTLNLEAFRINTFPLDSINEAIAKAPSYRGLECAVIVP